jgi:hypothetical protein
MSNMFKRRASTIAFVAAATLLAGCATPAHKENMSAAPSTVVRKLPYSVAVETKGGSETGVMDSSNVSNADLKVALENSITKSSLFKSVLQGRNGADYELTVTVSQLKKPMFGGAFTVTLETGWSLVKVSDKSIALRKAVTTSHTAELSDSLIGVTRLRLALEGAVRNNIAEGLKAISELPI